MYSGEAQHEPRETQHCRSLHRKCLDGMRKQSLARKREPRILDGTNGDASSRAGVQDFSVSTCDRMFTTTHLSDHVPTFYFHIEARATPAPTSKSPDEREFAIDSGASMHMLSNRYLTSEEPETLRRSRNPLWYSRRGGVRSFTCMVENIILVTTGDVFELCFSISRFIPAESTCELLVDTVRTVRELSGTSGACFSVHFLFRQRILCTRLFLLETWHAPRLKKSHV